MNIGVTDEIVRLWIESLQPVYLSDRRTGEVLRFNNQAEAVTYKVLHDRPHDLRAV